MKCLNGKHRVLAAIACVVQLARPSTALAQGSDIVELSLEELLNVRVTTATRTSELARDVPARIEVITADQIEQRGYRSLSDVLTDLPDFKVERGADQDLPLDVVVQGTRGSSRMIILLDGIRISSPTGEALPILANYPVHTARQIEVVYGPGSALYGADAFSAVVNIITRDPNEAEGVSFSQSFGQFGLSNTTASYGARVGRARFLVGVQALSDRQPNLPNYYPNDFGSLDAQRSGTFNTIFGPVQPAATVPPDYANPLSAHSIHATMLAGGLQLMLFKSQSTAPTSPAYTPDNAVYSDEAFNRNHLLVGAAALTLHRGETTSTTTVTASRHELDPQSGYRNVYSNMEKSYKYAYGSMIKTEQQVSWKIGSEVTATVGAAAEHYFAIPQGADLNAPVESHDTPGTILGTDIRDDFFKIRYENFGGYVQAQYRMRPSVTVTVGARGDHNTRYGATFNPRVGLVWQPGRLSSVQMLYGSAFLAPSPYQQYAHYGAFYSVDDGQTYQSDFWHLANPDLKPQKKSTTEVAARHTVSAHVEIWGSAFYSHFTNLIRESVDREDRYAGSYKGWPVALIELSANDGREATHGGRAGVDIVRALGPHRQIAGRMWASFADGRIEDESDHVEIGGMAPVQAHLSADVKWNGWSASPRLSLVGTQRVLALTQESGRRRRRTLDGYALLNINLRRTNVFKSINAFVTIENALDQRYRSINLRAFNNPEELIGAPQNPRRITVGLEVRIP